MNSSFYRFFKKIEFKMQAPYRKHRITWLQTQQNQSMNQNLKMMKFHHDHQRLKTCLHARKIGNNSMKKHFSTWKCKPKLQTLSQRSIVTFQMLWLENNATRFNTLRLSFNRLTLNRGVNHLKNWNQVKVLQCEWEDYSNSKTWACLIKNKESGNQEETSRRNKWTYSTRTA